MTALIEGNFTQSQAKTFFEIATNTLRSKTSNYTYDALGVELPERPHIIKRRNLNIEDQNSFQNLYWQVGKVSLAEEMRWVFDFLSTITQEKIIGANHVF